MSIMVKDKMETETQTPVNRRARLAALQDDHFRLMVELVKSGDAELRVRLPHAAAPAEVDQFMETFRYLRAELPHHSVLIEHDGDATVIVASSRDRAREFIRRSLTRLGRHR